MAAQKFKITYTDGTEVEVKASPKAQVMTERFLRQQGGLGSSTAIEASVRLAFESSKPGIGNVGYEEWMEKIEEILWVCPVCGGTSDDPDLHVCPKGAKGDESEDPTPEAPSPTPSSD